MQVEITEGSALFSTTGVPFRSFAMLGGDLTGTTEDGRLLKVEMIHRQGSKTAIHYYDEDGAEQVSVRDTGYSPTQKREY